MRYIVSFSGGKDSTATLLFMLERINKEDLDVIFIDTKFEADETYDYLEYIENKLGISIIRIESEGFENLCKRYKFIPNVSMRFCTKELKIKPFNKLLYENYVSKNIDFIVCEGLRREESSSRSNIEVFEIVKGIYNRKSFYIKKMYPIAYWSEDKVFKYIEKKGLKKNPIYDLGFKRVGCMPCIFFTKELLYMPKKYKDRVKKLEEEISYLRGEKVTFFNNSQKYLNQDILFNLEELFSIS